MSEQNQTEGQQLYAIGDAETRAWFERQWKIWPKRADEHLTTNLSLHYGGIIAYRIEHGKEPALSKDLRSNVEWHDQHTSPPPPAGADDGIA